MSQLKTYKHTDAPMTGDTEWTGCIPPGHQIIDITFVNSTANPATIDCGLSSGAKDIFQNQVIAANDITTIVLNKTPSMLTRNSLYINDDDASSSWNSSSLTAIMTMKKVMI